MGAIGLVLLWFGYSVAYYGYDQLSGGNNSYLSMLIPGKYQNATPDGGSSAQAAANSAASVASQKLQAAQATATKNAAPGGSTYPGGTGEVTGSGGITISYDANGNPTCINSKGQIVPCPAGTPTLTPSS